MTSSWKALAVLLIIASSGCRGNPQAGLVNYDPVLFANNCRATGGVPVRPLDATPAYPFACLERVINNEVTRCWEFGYIWLFDEQRCVQMKDGIIR